MKIVHVQYLENGYFSVKYINNGAHMKVIQDVTAIKMQVPDDEQVKNILLFMRKLKLEKLRDENFDELNYRNVIIYEYKNPPPKPDLDLDEILNLL
jgi:hypothetical protein